MKEDAREVLEKFLTDDTELNPGLLASFVLIFNISSTPVSIHFNPYFLEKSLSKTNKNSDLWAELNCRF